MSDRIYSCSGYFSILLFSFFYDNFIVKRCIVYNNLLNQLTIHVVNRVRNKRSQVENQTFMEKSIILRSKKYKTTCKKIQTPSKTVSSKYYGQAGRYFVMIKNTKN